MKSFTVYEEYVLDGAMAPNLQPEEGPDSLLSRSTTVGLHPLITDYLPSSDLGGHKGSTTLRTS